MKCFKGLLTLVGLVIITHQISAQQLISFSEFANFGKYQEANTIYDSLEASEKRVVFMGNSITEAWVQARPEFFQNTNFIGRGISGQTTPQMLLRFRKDVIDLRPKVVVILAGINDIAGNTGYTPIELIAENIITMSDIARFNKIKVIICSVTPAIGFPWSPDLTPVDTIIKLNSILESYASENGIDYVDFHSALKDDKNGLRVPDYTTKDDLVHPNEAGYMVMETLLQPAIDQALAFTHLSVNPLFSDHVVLQQKENITVWGKGLAGFDVEVKASWGEQVVATADLNDNWKLQLNTPEAGGPYKLVISSANRIIEIQDVMIGEVWLASGQSNMSMPLKGWLPNDSINNSVAEIENAKYPGIRMFKVTNKFSLEEESTFDGFWDVCSPENAGDYSASAYFFARRLHKALNIPVGIIHTSWGGTPAEAWISKKEIQRLGEFTDIIQAIEDPENERLTREWYSRWEKTPVPKDVTDWNHIDLNDLNIADPDYDHKNWSTIELPGRVDLYNGKDLDGAFWFRKTVKLTDVSLDYSFHMGFTDDADAVYFNGVRIGATAFDFSNSRNYPIPRSLLVMGENTVAIRIVDTGGPGSVTDGIKIRNEKGSEIPLNGEWSYNVSAEIFKDHIYHFSQDNINLEERPNIIYPSPYTTPSSLYNAMIHPLISFNIKGAIWYQGESNVGRAEQYKRLFPSLINDWRSRWNHNFPFYFVQIAPYEYNKSVENHSDESQNLRDAQRRTLSLENTGMVVTLDIGDTKNIHPSNKQDVGQRLAGLALVNDYGRKGVASGPLYKSYKMKRKKIIVEFDHVGMGLTSRGSDLVGFEIAGADKNYVLGKAKIVNNRIVVHSSSVPKPMFVRYAWRDTSVGSLFNKEGLPASPFTTED